MRRPLSVLTTTVALLAVWLVGVTGGPASASGATHSTKWLLNHLTVGPTDHAGYQRSLFKLWDSAGNGCDVRDRVLIRDAVNVTVGPGCKLTGTWKSPYDGIVTTNSTLVQVDHVVPLADAWRSGAWRWSPATREAYANDIGTKYDLLAVSAHSNESKSDRDPSEYLPPRTSFDCRYMADYVGVLWRWRLHISPSLKSFLVTRLARCDWPNVHEPTRPTVNYATVTNPSATPSPTPTPSDTPTPTASPTVTATPTPTQSQASGCTKTSSGNCIVAGQFCPSASRGKYGTDAQGRLLICGDDGHWHYA